jgi:hypothetical protein
MYFSSPDRPHRTRSPRNVLLTVYKERPGREADHSVASSAEGKNEWSYTPTVPTLLHGVHVENHSLGKTAQQ